MEARLLTHDRRCLLAMHAKLTKAAWHCLSLVHVCAVFQQHREVDQIDGYAVAFRPSFQA